MKKLFWKLASKFGAEALTNIFTGHQYLHRVYFLGPNLIKGVAGMYSDSRICLNLIEGSDLPFEHYECRGKDKVWRGPGWFAFRKHTDFHRVEIPEGGYAVTLFVKGKRNKNSTFFKMHDGSVIKDLKYWRQHKIGRETIAKMIQWKTPQEIQSDINSR